MSAIAALGMKQPILTSLSMKTVMCTVAWGLIWVLTTTVVPDKSLIKTWIRIQLTIPIARSAETSNYCQFPISLLCHVYIVHTTLLSEIQHRMMFCQSVAMSFTFPITHTLIILIIIRIHTSTDLRIIIHFQCTAQQVKVMWIC